MDALICGAVIVNGILLHLMGLPKSVLATWPWLFARTRTYRTSNVESAEVAKTHGDMPIDPLSCDEMFLNASILWAGGHGTAGRP